ncbi:hypothetical protein KCH_71200 [Kitasatospora cheerisanensis KCTC 2395]|uniref:Uncharacterized protein n=1 Tax=Kitasatospora cheerisanensis KCTC 2395 TaxID=1348663 RepID=A0A066YSG2_9ACTN|nr:hypothetical protein KCH_71200 [Kitasatospora cheerisanensis KCTC 2395]
MTTSRPGPSPGPAKNDVAARASVGLKTVSGVVNGESGLSPGRTGPGRHRRVGFRRTTGPACCAPAGPRASPCPWRTSATPAGPRRRGRGRAGLPARHRILRGERRAEARAGDGLLPPPGRRPGDRPLRWDPSVARRTSTPAPSACTVTGRRRPWRTCR